MQLSTEGSGLMNEARTVRLRNRMTRTLASDGCRNRAYSSSGGISSSIYRINVTRISVVSLPRRTSLTKRASMAICTCPCQSTDIWFPTSSPSPKHLAAHHTEYSRTTARPVPSRHQEAQQNLPEGSHQTAVRMTCCRSSSWSLSA